MDKLMDNPWFIKILALVLAVLLYSSVANPGKKLTDVYVPGANATESIQDIPVKAYYDTKNLVVSGIPNTVNMTMKGPITHVQTAKALRNFEVYVDLTNAKVGRQKVKLRVRNLSDKITAVIKPASIYVTVQEKISRNFKVDAEFNRNQIEDGFSAGQALVEPGTVEITGAKDVLDRVAYVKAALTEKNKLNETTTEDAPIQVLDRNLNKLNVVVDPSTVRVTIPVKSNSKTVPINPVQKGTPPAGVTVDSIILDINQAMIIGSEDVLKNIDSVRVEVDVSKITKSTTLDLPVIISNGVTKVDPQMVKVTIAVRTQGEKTVSGVPLKIKGLSQQYKAEINDPSSQTINLIVDGSSTALKTIGPGDFTASIDLSNLDIGSYDVDIKVEGPPDVNWKSDKSTAKITITDNA